MKADFLPTEVVAIWGGRGSGKSYLARDFVHQLTAKHRALRVVTIDPVGVGGLSTAREVAAALAAGDRRVTLTSAVSAECLQALFAAYLASTKAAPVLVVCDEAPAYLHQTSAALQKLVFQGRHRGLGLLLIGQRPTSVHVDFRSQAAVTYWGRITDARDMSTAAQSIGRPAAQTLATAPQGKFLQHPPALVTSGKKRVSK